MLNPSTIVRDRMFSSDAYSQWLGIVVEHVDTGTCTLTLKVRPEMTNGFEICHGGISYAIADSALAFAANSYGQKAVSIETSIAHLRPSFTNDILTAIAIEKNRSKTLGHYEVVITNQNEKPIALFKGTVFIKEEVWT